MCICKNVLPSSFINRPDLQSLDLGRIEQAQNHKEKLEQLQRKDEKLRKLYF